MVRIGIGIGVCVLLLMGGTAGGQSNPIFGGGSPFGGGDPGEKAPQPPQPRSTRPAESGTSDPADGQQASDQRGNGQLDITAAGEIVLNFDNADIYEVIRALAEVLEIDYIVDPGVKGRVTIHTSGSLKTADLMPVFYQILDANGLTAVREGNLYRIVTLKDASRQAIDASTPARKQRGGIDGDAVIQVIPLEFISAPEMAKLLTPFVSANGTIVSHEGSDTLIVVDRRANLQKLLKLVDAFDVSLFQRARHRFFPLKHADPETTAEVISEILAAYAAGDEAVGSVVALPRMGMILVISPDEQVFAKAESLIRQLDVPQTDVEPKIHVYFVKNGKAGELSDILNRVFSEKAVSARSRSTNQEPSGTAGQKSEGKPSSFQMNLSFKDDDTTRESPAAQNDQPSTGALRRDIRINPDEIRNALIIEATPSDYRMIEDLLNRLDVLPRQVLIEVMIAEISLNASTELGVEWEYIKGDGGTPTTSMLSGNIGAAGLQYVVGQANRWKASLSALAQEDKVNILSSPTLLASDNKEAKIDISTEIPVASAQYEYQSEGNPLLETNIQYRNTGVILSVTPHINEFGLVSMDVSQEVSEQSENVDVGNESLPSFFKRSVDTSLTVKHGQTIVIGGLIRQNVSDGHSGVPCLGGLPGVGFLFGKQKQSTEKTELIILITPRVISTLDDVDVVTEDFRNKIGDIPAAAR